MVESNYKVRDKNIYEKDQIIQGGLHYEKYVIRKH